MARQSQVATTRLIRAPHRTLAAFSFVALPALALALACAGEDPMTATVELPMMAVNPNSGHTGISGRSYATDMSQELSTTVTGDPDGIGTALLTLNAGQRTICWSNTAANISTAVASHIHNAPAGLSGPIVLPLTPPDASGVASGCADDVDRALIVDLLRNPASYYVNVHTTEFLPGAIRGQLAH